MNRKLLKVNLTAFFLLALVAMMYIYIQICLRSTFFPSPVLAVIVGLLTGYVIWTSLMRSYIKFMLCRLLKSERSPARQVSASFEEQDNLDDLMDEALLDELDRFENNVQEMSDDPLHVLDNGRGFIALHHNELDAETLLYPSEYQYLKEYLDEGWRVILRDKPSE